MPIPTLTGLPPNPTFQDLVDRVNKVVRETNNMLLNLDSLNVVSLTADHIDAGTIDADIVTIRSDLTAGAFVQIDGNGLVINDGSMDTFRADITGKVTMTGALIRSKNGYPTIVLNPNGDLVGAYVDANNSVTIVANDLGSPALNFNYSGSVVGQLNTRLGLLSVEGRPHVELFADFGNIYLTSGGNVIQNKPDWSNFQNQSGSLQDSLNGKANYGSSTSSASGGGHNHGIPNGTVLMVDGGGTVTWSVYGGFTHSHTQN